jgi:hypothetical protein
MTLLTGAWATIRFIFFTTVYWLSLLFVAPFRNPEILWVLIPIWINMVFTDFFQEKHETSMGNAITNGAVAVWVGIDWIRHLISTLEGFEWLLVVKFFICLVLLAFGVFVIVKGVQGEKYIKIIARIREVSYLQLMFSLVIYGIVTISWKFILVVLIYMPVFYFIFEAIDKYTPDLVKEGGSGDSSL